MSKGTYCRSRQQGQLPAAALAKWKQTLPLNSSKIPGILDSTIGRRKHNKIRQLQLLQRPDGCRDRDSPSQLQVLQHRDPSPQHHSLSSPCATTPSPSGRSWPFSGFSSAAEVQAPHYGSYASPFQEVQPKPWNQLLSGHPRAA